MHHQLLCTKYCDSGQCNSLFLVRMGEHRRQDAGATVDETSNLEDGNNTESKR